MPGTGDVKPGFHALLHTRAVRNALFGVTFAHLLSVPTIAALTPFAERVAETLNPELEMADPWLSPLVISLGLGLALVALQIYGLMSPAPKDVASEEAARMAARNIAVVGLGVAIVVGMMIVVPTLIPAFST